MKQILKSLTKVSGKEIISSELAFATGKTDRDHVMALITQLRPRRTQRPLIRLGPATDGGYLVPDDLSGILAVFSPGVSSESGFEKDCAERSMDVFMADKSVDEPAESHPRFHFTKKFVGALDDDSFMTLDEWTADSLSESSEGDLMLQMDIEGSEYESLLSVSTKLLCRYRILVVEFHQLNELWNRPFFNLASRVFTKLLQNHTCVHIHPNNEGGAYSREQIEIPRAAEFTFLRNDRGLAADYVSELPHPLDRDNTANPPLLLQPYWHG